MREEWCQNHSDFSFLQLDCFYVEIHSERNEEFSIHLYLYQQTRRIFSYVMNHRKKEKNGLCSSNHSEEYFHLFRNRPNRKYQNHCVHFLVNNQNHYTRLPVNTNNHCTRLGRNIVIKSRPCQKQASIQINSFVRRRCISRGAIFAQSKSALKQTLHIGVTKWVVDPLPTRLTFSLSLSLSLSLSPAIQNSALGHIFSADSSGLLATAPCTLSHVKHRRIFCNKSQPRSRAQWNLRQSPRKFQGRNDRKWSWFSRGLVIENNLLSKACSRHGFVGGCRADRIGNAGYNVAR